MYALITNNKKILKTIKKILEANGEKVIDCKEYIITNNDPMPLIPEYLKSRVSSCEVNDHQTDFTDNKITKGQIVTVIAGKYKGISGIVRDVFTNKCSIELNVWGKIKMENIDIDDIVITEKPNWA